MRWNPYPMLHGRPRTSGPRGKPNTGVLINVCNNNIISKGILYLQTSALFSHHQRSFLLPQMETNPETHSQTLWREWENLKRSGLNVIFPSDPSPRVQETRRRGGINSVRGTMDASTKETRPSKHNGTVANMSSEMEAACTGLHRTGS